MFAELRTSPAPAAADAEERPAFLTMLNQAAAIARRHYPGAQLLEADVNFDLYGRGWRFVFNLPATSVRPMAATAILYNVDGEFVEPIQHIDAPWSSSKPIPLPIDLDVGEAEDLALEAGYGGLVSSIILRWALHPDAKEPHYVLTIPEQDVLVFIGVRSREVTVGPLTV
jgi:hypothetical protein